jgi:hypothetical protein
LILLLAIPTDLKTQSVLIDTSIVSQANHFLIKGANARIKLHRLEQLIKVDSTIILYQDSVIQRQTINIDSLNTRLQKKENTIYKQREWIKGLGIWAIICSLMLIKL